MKCLVAAAASGLLVLLVTGSAWAQTEDPEGKSGEHRFEIRIESEDDASGLFGDLGPESAALNRSIIEKLDADQLSTILLARQSAVGMAEEAVIVPLAFFLCLATVVGLALLYRYRQSSQRQQTLRLMVEKGAEIPPELLSPAPKRGSDQRRGLVLVGLGLGLIVFLGQVAESEGVWSLGLIPMLIGVAYLAVWKLESRERRDESA